MRALLVPLKAFAQAKARLADSLAPKERECLIQELAETVLAAAGEMPSFVVCDDGAVADWSIAHGATALYAPGLGLNGAVSAGVRLLAALGFSLVVVAHADLPFVRGLDRFGDDGAATLAPDRHDDGTNVIAVPADVPFSFSYGPGSFARHLCEAERIGLPTCVIRDERYATDIDVAADLALLDRQAARKTSKRTSAGGDA